MKRIVLANAVLAIGLAPGAVFGQSFVFGFETIDFHCAQALGSPPGSEVQLELFCTISSLNNPTADSGDPRGAAGFSMSLGAKDWRFVSVTTAGTIVEDLFTGGLMRIGIVDPDRVPDRIPGSEIPPGQAQGEGAIAEVVFSVQQKKELPPQGRERVLAIVLKGSVPGPENPAGKVFYESGKQSAGPPVINSVAFEGKTHFPARAECAIGRGSDKFLLRVDGEASNGDPTGRTLRLPSPAGDKTRGAAFAIIDSRTGEANGAAGWSLSISSSGALTIRSASILGTNVDDLFFKGFNKTEIVDPTIVSNPAGSIPESEVPPDQPQGPGLISGLILSLLETRMLPPEGSSRVLRIEFEQAEVFASEHAPSRTGRFFYRNGLKGSGPPVRNFIIFRGMSINPEVRTGLDVIFEPRPPAGANFRRGDANGDGRHDIADAVWIIGELFLGGPRTACRDAADANGDGRLTVADATAILQHQFLGREPPPAPHPDCGRGSGATPESCPTGSTACPG